MQASATKNIENDIEIIHLQNAYISAKIAVNIGNTLFSLVCNQEEILHFPFSLSDYKNNIKLAGNPFMHPWANRLQGDFITIEQQHYLFPKSQQQLLFRDDNKLPLHGLLLKSDKWKTIALEQNEKESYHEAILTFSDANWLTIFPFRHTVKMTHLLRGNAITISSTIINDEEKKMPISFGFHPYLKQAKNTTLTIPAKDILELDELQLPTGKAFRKEDKFHFTEDKLHLGNNSLDDGFSQLNYTDEQAIFSINNIDVCFDKHYTFAQIYAPNKANKPYVCIEPMTAPCNALNTNACVLIEPNEQFTATFKIIVHPKSEN
ncbi:MAG: aldose 1-epimerase [Chitinophagales bacterium]